MVKTIKKTICLFCLIGLFGLFGLSSDAKICERFAIGVGFNYQSVQLRFLQNGYEYQLRIENPTQFGISTTALLYNVNRIITYAGCAGYITCPGCNMLASFVGIEMILFKNRLTFSVEPTIFLWDFRTSNTFVGANFNYYF